MTHYEFKNRNKKNRNKYLGSWTESLPKEIPLPFTAESLKTVLEWGASPESSSYTHQDIAHWCDRHHWSTLEHYSQDKRTNAIVDLASDVDAQWDLFLANTFTLEQLQTMDFASVHLPLEWFRDWIKQLNKIIQQTLPSSQL